MRRREMCDERQVQTCDRVIPVQIFIQTQLEIGICAKGSDDA